MWLYAGGGMTVLPPITSQGPGAVELWARMLQKLWNMSGPPVAKPTHPCAPVPVLVLGNDRDEWAAEGGERIGFGNIGFPVAPMNRGTLHLFNPVGDATQAPILVKLELLILINQTAQNSPSIFRYDGITSANRTQGNNVRSRDTRLGDNGLALQLFKDDVIFANISAVPAAPLFVTSPEGTAFDATNNAFYFKYDRSIILAPGTGILISPTVDAQAVKANISWRERAMNNQELQLP